MTWRFILVAVLAAWKRHKRGIGSTRIIGSKSMPTRISQSRDSLPLRLFHPREAAYARDLAQCSDRKARTSYGHIKYTIFVRRNFVGEKQKNSTATSQMYVCVRACVRACVCVCVCVCIRLFFSSHTPFSRTP